MLVMTELLWCFHVPTMYPPGAYKLPQRQRRRRQSTKKDRWWADGGMGPM